MKKGKLLIFSGLPGSGKSTIAKLLAEKIGAVYLRIDTVENALREICKMQKVEGEGYRLSYRIASDNLKVGSTVIADSVNPIELSRKEWTHIAKETNSESINIEFVCSDNLTHKARVENRRHNDQEIPGHKWPSWEQVIYREYEAWDKGLDIRVDTFINTPEKCVELISNYLKTIANKQ